VIPQFLLALARHARQAKALARGERGAAQLGKAMSMLTTEVPRRFRRPALAALSSRPGPGLSRHSFHFARCLDGRFLSVFRLSQSSRSVLLPEDEGEPKDNRWEQCLVPAYHNGRPGCRFSIPPRCVGIRTISSIGIILEFPRSERSYGTIGTSAA